MKRHRVDLAVGHERASAAPSLEVTRRALGGRRAPGNAPTQAPVLAEAAGTSSLRAQQLWFAGAVMTPDSEADAAGDGDAERHLTPGPRMSATDRLEIYRRGYHARLIECLADDYPALRHALGPDAFDGVCRAYIARYPSTGPNLNFFGRNMAELFRSGQAPELDVPAGFAGDLAALEWAIVEIIHAPSSEPLTLEGLGHVPMEAWPSARLVPNSAFRLLSFDYPVNTYFQAFRSDEAPEVPAASGSATVVYRSGPTVWRMDLTVPMHRVLAMLVAGEALEASLERAAESLGELGEVEAGERISVWFREWVSSGLFARVDLG